jgi:hypothetical protein
MICERGWQSFKAEWLKDVPRGKPAPTGYVPMPGER